MEYVILTNNSSIGSELPGFDIVRVSGGLTAIYQALCDHLQNGHEIISVPLPPNVPLIRSPIRSVILRKTKRKYDSHGLIAVEKARERTAILDVIDNENTRQHIEFIDKSRLDRAISQLAELDGERG